MLVLSRRAGERIVIGDDIIVQVIDAGSGEIRIGVEAPRELSVHREEVYNRIQKEVNDRVHRIQSAKQA